MMLSATTVAVRRFEPSASADFAFYGFLKDLGYKIHLSGYFYFVCHPGKRGRGMKMSRAELVDLLDDERLRAGLEPIRKVNSVEI